MIMPGLTAGAEAYGQNIESEIQKEHTVYVEALFEFMK